jgi:hypothetical protein
MGVWSLFRFDGIEAGLWILDLTRFLDANRCPLRLKTLWSRPPRTSPGLENAALDGEHLDGKPSNRRGSGDPLLRH